MANESANPRPARTPAKSSILQRQLLRASVYMLILAGLFFGYRWFSDYIVDPDSGNAETSGWVGAIESTDTGSRAVIIKSDGTITPDPDASKSSTDKDLVWRPDGNRLFFSSDRGDGKSDSNKGFQIVRWNLASSRTEIRTVGTRSKARLNFSPPGWTAPVMTGMLVAGGFVYEFDPRAGTLRQVLPPVVGAQATDEEGGAGGQFEAIYKSIGTSFKEAKWLKDRGVVVAVMRRDNGEALIVQPLGVQKDEKGNVTFSRPIALVAGESIDFDVNSNGDFVYSVTNLRVVDPREVPAEYKKNGQIVLPYRHGVFIARNEDGKPVVQTIALSNDNSTVFGKIRFSPDGKEVLVQGGAIGANGAFDVKALVLMPAIQQGAQEGRAVVGGAVGDFNWSPDGERFVYTARGQGKQGIFVANRDGSNSTQLVNSGDFSEPAFSPQLKK